MRTVSRVRKSIVWIFKLLFERQLQSCTERIRLSLSPCLVRSFTDRGVSIGNKNIPDRVRFTRALLESKDLSMRFSLPLCVWVSGISPCSLETASEKRSPRTSYHPGWEVEFTGGGISKLPSARRDSQQEKG